MVNFTDFTWSPSFNHKVAKAQLPQLRLVLNCDVLQTLAATKQPNQIFIGFSLQTTLTDLTTARHKLQRKRLDMIVINEPQSVGTSTTRVVVVTPNQVHYLPQQSKLTTAHAIVRLITNIN